MIAPLPRPSFEGCAANVERLFAELQRCPVIGVAILDEQLRFRSVNSTLA
jgi:hypothetical protein